VTELVRARTDLDVIVAAIDLSEPSRAALEVAAAIAGRHAARLYVVHVVGEENRALPGLALQESRLAELYELAQQRAGGARVVECVRLGLPAREIAALAREKEASLIVTGTHAYAGLSRLVGGSTAGEIVRAADCPVLIVREGSKTDAPRRALAGVDYSDFARDALRAALPLLAKDAELDLVHVIADDVARSASRLSADDAREAMIEVSRTNLERWASESLPARPSRTRAIVTVGDASVALADLAVGGGYDLVVCGTHGRTGLKRLLLGSVSEAIVGASRAPVLVVRETRRVAAPPSVRAGL
jgi:nucleotide-binding universal stress UspA family protein